MATQLVSTINDLSCFPMKETTLYILTAVAVAMLACMIISLIYDFEQPLCAVYGNYYGVIINQ